MRELNICPIEYAYLGQSSNSPRNLAKRAGPLVVAEMKLRRLSHRRSNEPLLMIREASPLSAGRVEARILNSSSRGVYDFDDALMESASKRESWKRCVRAADVVVAGNDYLGERASEFHSDVRVIPSCVRVEDYALKTDYGVSDPPRILWIGSPSTEKYLQVISDPLLRVHRDTGARLVLVSSGERSLGILDVMTDRFQWSSEFEKAVPALADVGIMPLPVTPWSRGKCAYKLLQYGAAGLPVVGSPVGANALALSRMGGTPASTAEEWYGALRALLEAPVEDRMIRGSAAQRAVQLHYSYRSWSASMRSALVCG
ncbi:glycosyltransferase [Georgenia muralis]